MNDEPTVEAQAAEALQAASRYLSGARLYPEQHPGRTRLLEEAYSDFAVLLDRDPAPTFTFLEEEVVYRDSALRKLAGWPWSRRLLDAGIGRLELTEGLEQDELARFLDHVITRLSSDAEPEAEPGAFPHIVWGEASVRQPGEPSDEGRSPPTGVLSLEEEARSVEWIHQQAEREGRIPVLETVLAVQTLSVAMHVSQELVTPFVQLARSDAYTAGHCINVAILTMSMVERMDRPGPAVLAAGTAGLLHDIGKVEVPARILNKEGSLTEEEWSTVRQHPATGCKILLESGTRFRLAATVAYEHHLRPGGGGYPELNWPRPMSETARLVQVCDLYDALRSDRPYRDALPPTRVREVLTEERGSGLDADFVDTFNELIEERDPEEMLREAERVPESIPTPGEIAER